MDDAAFQDLALRVIAREAGDAEVRALDAELASHPTRQGELDALRATLRMLETTLPMTDAIGIAGPELPAYRVNELRTAVRQHFGPAAARAPKAFGLAAALRWLLGGTGFAVVWVAVVLACFANRSVEIGVYQTDLVRGDNQGITAQDVPAARIVAFDQDAPFDQWQDRPLAWNQHAKIWVDNERDLLHIVERDQHGQIEMLSQPLAPTAEGQRDQIKQVVRELQK